MGGFVGVNGSTADEGTEGVALELAADDGGPMEDVVPLRLTFVWIGVCGGGGT